MKQTLVRYCIGIGFPKGLFSDSLHFNPNASPHLEDLENLKG
jgi:hypothetical protein